MEKACLQRTEARQDRDLNYFCPSDISVFMHCSNQHLKILEIRLLAKTELLKVESRHHNHKALLIRRI